MTGANPLCKRKRQRSSQTQPPRPGAVVQHLKKEMKPSLPLCPRAQENIVGVGLFPPPAASPTKGTPQKVPGSRFPAGFYAFNMCPFPLALLPTKVAFLGPRPFLHKTPMPLDRQAGRQKGEWQESRSKRYTHRFPPTIPNCVTADPCDNLVVFSQVMLVRDSSAPDICCQAQPTPLLSC